MKNLNFPGLPRVLVIDDEEPVRETLRRLLQAEGVAVETSADVEDALRRIARRGFDVVILDQHLRGAEGLGLLSRLRQGDHPADVVVLAG